MGKRKLLDCESIGDNHSNDKITLYYGQPNPLHLCGFHAKYHLYQILTEIGN